jgi:dienelactone hydrolase
MRDTFKPLRPSLTYSILTIVLLAASALAADDPFAYDTSIPFDIKLANTVKRGGVEVRDITFASLTGGRTEAYLIVPEKTSAAILFAHWYEPPDPTSNRTQFIDEAAELAKHGVVSLLPATMWSDPEWFRKRKREEDVRNSIAQVKELRRAMDVLVSLPGVERKRVAYVGHDFGAMFGAVMAGVDKRASAYALQAGTPEFANWYLFGPPMREPARSEFVKSLKIVDPAQHIGKASPAPVFLQFAARDFFVPHDKAEEFWQATREPKRIVFYDAEHKMNGTARQDRIAWLKEVLRLR